jgi:EAL domain-containing protein (putative c-di-GMP-specific phosphodiesterase class I)
VKLAFDDFGTGYASLNYLTRFPVSRIKIDRCFVAKITDGSNDATIVKSLIAMAHNLGLKVIAEGVETEAQAAFLVQEGCEEAQGFLYSKPLPDAEFERYLVAGELPRWERSAVARQS